MSSFEKPARRHQPDKLRFFASLLLCAFALIVAPAARAQTNVAPGAPGRDAQWATAGKQGVGTSNTLESKVWFTLADGVMTEVYYPDVTLANVHLLQFVVVDPQTGKVETEQTDAVHAVVHNYTNLSFEQRNRAKSGEWEIWKSYVTDPARNTVLVSVWFLSKNKNVKLYVYYDPSIDNSGMHDTGWTENGVLYASDKQNVSALVANGGFGASVTNGFLGTSDGLTQLRTTGRVVNYQRAEKGNVVQLAEVKLQPRYNGKDGGWETKTSLALGFGSTAAQAGAAAQASLAEGYQPIYGKFARGWNDYVKTLRKVDARYQTQFNMAAMILRAHEDKTHRGANIASLSIPWGGGDTANENTVAGYHLVWSRDLYQVATAFMALGDKEAAVRALDFLFKVQQKPDGSFPQNSFLDGKPFWGSLQLDEVAYPLILAYQLGRNDKATYENHVKKAADFLIKNGPRTPQERWEEEAGYSPSTIAAEIAGLVCAADIARKNGDEASATLYLAAADEWARKVELWTATTTGRYGDGHYYLRITQNGKPDAGEKIELNNGAGFFDEREIVDAGFLELVRLGVRPADDPLIAKSLKVVDQVLRVATPNGEGFYRYNHDGYGEMDDGRRWNWDGKYTGKGRLWALLSGERGQYDLAVHALGRERQGDKPFPRGYMDWELRKREAARRLDDMLRFANEGLMIPEQIWDKKETPANVDRQFVPELKFGEGTGSATPLAWSMAQFIRLAVNLEEGRNLETPDIVYQRYAKNGVGGQTSGFGGSGDEAVTLPVKAGEKFSLTREAPPGTKIAYIYAGRMNFVTVGADRKATVEIVAPETTETVIAGVVAPGGSSAFERVKLTAADRVAPPPIAAATLEKLKTAKTSPFFDGGKTYLFYRGAAASVVAAGDFSGWNPGFPLQKIGDDLFAREFDFAPDARVEYRLVVDGRWIEDPLNPNGLDNGVGGRNSFFALPGYRATELAGGEAPKLEEFEIATKKFGARRIRVFLPDAYPTSNARLPVLYVQDGSEYFTKAGAANVQNALVKAGKVKPFIIVFIDPRDRMKEYWANDDWADFVALELVPEIDRRYRTVAARDGRATLGASLGGVTSLWIGLRHPDVFARLGGQSSSFWVDDERVVEALERLDARQTKFTFYLDDGAFEGTDDTRRVNLILRAKGFPVTYREGATGHNWTSWRDRLGEAFVALWK